jgi:hypothetical protein
MRLQCIMIIDAVHATLSHCNLEAISHMYHVTGVAIPVSRAWFRLALMTCSWSLTAALASMQARNQGQKAASPLKKALRKPLRCVKAAAATIAAKVPLSCESLPDTVACLLQNAVLLLAA